MSPVETTSSIIAQYKDTIGLILTWLAGNIAFIANKIRKWERLSFSQHISHLIISWFVGYLTYLLLNYFHINWPMQWVIIWTASYSWIQIIEAFEMIKAKVIYNLLIDFIKFKLWK